MNYEQLIWIGVLGTFVLVIIAIVRIPEYLSRRRMTLRRKRNRDNGRIALVFTPYEFDIHEQTHGIDAVDAFIALREQWTEENPTKRIISTAMLTKTIRGHTCFDGILIEYRYRKTR